MSEIGSLRPKILKLWRQSNLALKIVKPHHLIGDKDWNEEAPLLQLVIQSSMSRQQSFHCQKRLEASKGKIREVLSHHARSALLRRLPRVKQTKSSAELLCSRVTSLLSMQRLTISCLRTWLSFWPTPDRISNQVSSSLQRNNPQWTNQAITR